MTERKEKLERRIDVLEHEIMRNLERTEAKAQSAHVKLETQKTNFEAARGTLDRAWERIREQNEQIARLERGFSEMVSTSFSTEQADRLAQLAFRILDRNPKTPSEAIDVIADLFPHVSVENAKKRCEKIIEDARRALKAAGSDAWEDVIPDTAHAEDDDDDVF